MAFDEAAGAHVVRRARADVVPGGPGRLHYHRQIMKEQSMRDQSIWEHVTVRGTVAGASGASAAGADAVGESDGGAVVGDAMGADAVGVDAVAGAFVQWYVNEKLAVKWRAGEAWASTDRCGLVMDDARAADIRKRWTEAAVAAQQVRRSVDWTRCYGWTESRLLGWVGDGVVQQVGWSVLWGADVL